MRWLDSIIDSMDMNLRKLKDRGAQNAVVHGVTESDMTQQLNKNNIFKMVIAFINNFEPTEEQNTSILQKQSIMY